MQAIWDIHAIAAMNAESKVRNLCRQLRQEADWGRAFAYRGSPVRRWQELPTGVTLLCGGGKGRQWVIVELHHKPASRKFKPSEAAELYAEIMAVAERAQG